MLGFTLIELLMSLTIVGLLAAIAVPTYQTYMDKARYTEMVNASSPYRTAVGVCYQRTGTLTTCIGGQNGIPPNITNNTVSLVRYVFVLGNGQIFVFPNDINNFTLLDDYYILTPTVTNSTITWAFSGPAVTKGYVN